MKRTRSFLWFPLLILLFLALRLGNILTAVESVSWFEELYEGTIAKELIEGLKVSFWNYQATSYGAGSLYMGVLATPFFRLFGPSLFALKLTPLLFFSLPTLIFLYFTLKRHFNQKAAFWGVFLFIFSPPAFTANSLMAVSTHTPGLLFSAAMLFLFYESLYASQSRLVFLICFGIVSGFAFYFIHTTALTFISCFVSWFFLDRSSFLSRKSVFLLIAFGIGLSPLIVFEFTHHLQATRFLKSILWPSARLERPLLALCLNGVRKTIKFFSDIPTSFCPRFGKAGSFLGYLYTGTFLALTPFVWRVFRHNRKILPLILHFPFFAVVYINSAYPVMVYGGFFQARYFIHSHFYLLLLTALIFGAQKLFPLKVAMVILGIVSQSLFLFKEDIGNAFHYKGYSYYLTSVNCLPPRLFSPFPDGSPNSIWKILNQYPEENSRQIYRVYILNHTDSYKKDPHLKSILGPLKALPLPYRYYFLEALGMRTDMDDVFSRRRLNGLLKAFSREEKNYAYRGLVETEIKKKAYSLTSGNPISNPGARQILVDEKDDRKLGEIFSFYWILNWYLFNEALHQVSPRRLPIHLENPEDFYRGVGWGLRIILTEDRVRTADWIKQLPPEGRGAALAGSRAYDKWYWLTPDEASNIALIK